MAFSCFFLVLSKSFVKNLLKKDEYFIKISEKGFNTHKIIKQGIIFPVSAQIKVLSAGRLSKNPKGIAPLSSVKGSIAEKNTISSGGMCASMFKRFILKYFIQLSFVLPQSI